MEALRLDHPAPPALLEGKLVDREGEPHTIAGVAAGRPTLLIFLRHFGCIGCSQHVAELAPRIVEFERLGLKTLLIGNGEPDFIAGFLERHDLEDKPVELLVDPELSVYEAAGFHRSWLRTVGPRALYDSLRARGRGFRGYSGSGDHPQQGGAILLDPAQRVRFHYANTSLGDRADTSDLVETAMRVALGSKQNLGLRI